MSETERYRQHDQDDQQIAARLLGLIREMVLELHAGRERRLRLTLESRLDRDLQLDSLSRVELLLRINRSFGIELSESVLTEAETPLDLLGAIRASGPAPDLRHAYTSAADSLAPAGDLPHAAETLPDVLHWHAETHPQRTHVYLYEEGPEPVPITYASLYASARRRAAAIQALGVRPGDNIALMLPTGRDYLDCFFGVLLAGCVPVPIYPPARLSQIEDHLRRHARMLDNAGTPLLITVHEARQIARLLRAQVPALRRVVTPSDLDADASELILHERGGDDTAFLQYTSGSTGDPKGVVLTHAHLLANIRAMGETLEADSTDVFVSWLPLYHDMGLIGAWLGSQYYAVPLVLMAPTAFLTSPVRWLRAIHRHRGTLSAAPNFGYELCLRRLSDDELDGLDLSSWRVAANGAEPVSPHTVRAFTERFGRYGLRRSAMMPVYGLAEAAVGLAFPPLDRGPLIDRIQRDALLTLGEAQPASGDVDSLEFVACGSPLPGYQIRIVDDSGRELPDRRQGRVEFTGPSATSGYYRNTEATRRLIHGVWLDTGDMGYLAGGDLYLTSRAKDMIIRGGRNLHPHELEEAVGQLDGIRAGCVAVFGTRDTASGTERLVVVAETRETDPERLDALRAQVNDVAVDVLGMPPDDIAMMPPHTVLKTSSGKIRRSAVRDRYESNKLGEAPAGAYRQFARLLLTSAVVKSRQWQLRARRLAYAAYMHFWFVLVAPAAWLMVVAAPTRHWRWIVARKSAQFLLKVGAIPIEVDGIEHVPAGGPLVFAANHASYLDGLVLTAVLPLNVSFVAKAELKQQWIAGIFLKRMGTAFVERFDLRAGASDAQRMAERVRAGDSLLYFPEGTLTREPGLMPFRLGAFTAAAETGVPVIPVAMQGTRSVLRCGSGFPYRHPIRISIGAPIAAAGVDWNAAMQLRDQVRDAILKNIDEPDLAARGSGLTR
jgi:1-acyl-sn-glycerol-3-phosphate acyltransferase